MKRRSSKPHDGTNTWEIDKYGYDCTFVAEVFCYSSKCITIIYHVPEVHNEMGFTTPYFSIKFSVTRPPFLIPDVSLRASPPHNCKRSL